MSNIKAGDLVMVVRGCDYCADRRDIGKVFIAGWIGLSSAAFECCGFGGGVPELTVNDSMESGIGFSVRHLIKIDPPATGDSLPTRKQLKVKA